MISEESIVMELQKRVYEEVLPAGEFQKKLLKNKPFFIWKKQL